MIRGTSVSGRWICASFTPHGTRVGAVAASLRAPPCAGPVRLLAEPPSPLPSVLHTQTKTLVNEIITLLNLIFIYRHCCFEKYVEFMKRPKNEKWRTWKWKKQPGYLNVVRSLTKQFKKRNRSVNYLGWIKFWFLVGPGIRSTAMHPESGAQAGRRLKKCSILRRKHGKIEGKCRGENASKKAGEMGDFDKNSTVDSMIINIIHKKNRIYMLFFFVQQGKK